MDEYLLQTKPYRRSRLMYVGIAAFEYLIQTMFAGTFLAALTNHLGLSDSLTGILAGFGSLGFAFQLLSLFFRPRNVKRFAIIITVFSELFFMSLYLTPFLPLSGEVRSLLFVIGLLCAYILFYFVSPKKTGWHISLVEDRQRGRFTAVKEIFSLISGIVFTYCMGLVFDRFRQRGDMLPAFLICTGAITFLSILNTSALFAIVKPRDALPDDRSSSFFSTVKQLFQNKFLWIISLLLICHKISDLCVASFLGTFLYSDLGMPQSQAVLLAAGGSLARMLVSLPLGALADKKSFAYMIRFCLIFFIASRLCIIFLTKSFSVPFLLAYYIFYGIAMGGINSGYFNIVFDHTPPALRGDASAISQTFGGVGGFLAVLALSPLVTVIQHNGNTVFGLPLYAQQLFAVISVLLSVLEILLLTFLLIPMERKLRARQAEAEK